MAMRGFPLRFGLDEPPADPSRREKFIERFSLSRNGNLWCHWRGLTLIVFKRHGDHRFSWSIVNADGQTRYCKKSFRTDTEALHDLYHEVRQQP